MTKPRFREPPVSPNAPFWLHPPKKRAKRKRRKGALPLPPDGWYVPALVKMALEEQDDRS